MNVVNKDINKKLVNKRTVNQHTLILENARYQGTGGVSQHNRSLDFIPAFLDTESGQSYVSCFADGRPAPIHIFDGLPESLIEERLQTGEIKSVKSTVISGFLRTGIFYTRDQVAAMC